MHYNYIMASKLNKVLESKGIKNLTDLTPEERETYLAWDKILSEGKVTVDKILEFCERELARIDAVWRQSVISGRDIPQNLVLLRVVYKTLADLIKAPKEEKAQLEEYLQNLVDHQKDVL